MIRVSELPIFNAHVFNYPNSYGFDFIANKTVKNLNAQSLVFKILLKQKGSLFMMIPFDFKFYSQHII